MNAVNEFSQRLANRRPYPLLPMMVQRSWGALVRRTATVTFRMRRRPHLGQMPSLLVHQIQPLEGKLWSL